MKKNTLKKVLSLAAAGTMIFTGMIGSNYSEKIFDTKTVSAASLSAPSLSYNVHCQSYGWLGSVKGGNIAGTTGKSKRMEAISINCSPVQYRVHVAKDGWQSWKYSGQTAGTIGQSKAIEAIQIKLNSKYSQDYDVFYQVHLQGIGWTRWYSNGEVAGTTGQSRRMEAIKIEIRKKAVDYSGAYRVITPFSIMLGSLGDEIRASVFFPQGTIVILDKYGRNSEGYDLRSHLHCLEKIA